MHEYQARLPLNWEWRAFEEIRNYLNGIRENERTKYDFLDRQNYELLKRLNAHEIQTIMPSYKIRVAELGELIDKVYLDIICKDPVLLRIFIHNNILPEDLGSRKYLRAFLPETLLSPYYDLLRMDLLKGKRLVKIGDKDLEGVPIGYLMVGQILNNLLWDFEHNKNIDAVKETGVAESVEKLRESRFSQSENEVIWNYHPFFRRKMSKNGVEVEVFRKEDFKRARKEKKLFRMEMDNNFCFLIKQANLDPREVGLFGDKPASVFDNNFASSPNYTVRFGSLVETIPLQLLPKYFHYIKKVARKYTLTKLHFRSSKYDGPEEKRRRKEDEISTSYEGLIRGVRTWDEKKGPPTKWLTSHISWGLGDGFKRVSTEADEDERVKREAHDHYGGNKSIAQKFVGGGILQEEIESSEGYLNNPVESGGTLLDLLESKGTILSQDGSVPTLEEKRKSPYEIEEEEREEEKQKNVILSKIRAEPGIVEILKKEEEKEALTAKERKAKSRFIIRHKKK